MEKSKKAYKINITNPVYCELLADAPEGAQYGEVKEFGEAMTITVTPTVASGSLFGNGAKVDASSLLTGMTVSFGVTKVPIEVRQDIYNLEVQDGVVIEKAGVTAKKIAFGYEVEQSDGTSELVWLLKGSPRPMATDNRQSEDNITYSTDTVEIDFTRRDFDKALRYIADTANPEFTDYQAAKWFTQGPSEPVAPDPDAGN